MKKELIIIEGDYIPFDKKLFVGNVIATEDRSYYLCTQTSNKILKYAPLNMGVNAKKGVLIVDINCPDTHIKAVEIFSGKNAKSLAMTSKSFARIYGGEE